MFTIICTLQCIMNDYETVFTSTFTLSEKTFVVFAVRS